MIIYDALQTPQMSFSTLSEAGRFDSIAPRDYNTANRITNDVAQEE